MASLFSDFNEHYSKLEKVFQGVTRQVFKPSHEIVLEKKMAEVKLSGPVGVRPGTGGSQGQWRAGGLLVV